jgi:hypothetical protein
VLLLGRVEVGGDSQRLPAIVRDRRIGEEELDELASLRDPAPGAEAELRLELTPAPWTLAHPTAVSLAGRAGIRLIPAYVVTGAFGPSPADISLGFAQAMIPPTA